MPNQMHDITACGWSLLQRQDTIRNLAEHPARITSFRFRGKSQDMPIISVKISLPAYRIANRRTKTLQEEYMTKHPDLPSDFFSTDVDSIAVQEAQDGILRELIEDKDLYDVFTNPKVQQDEPIICTRDGIVVNGNRRLCAWRKLYAEDSNKYAHFASIDIMLLPVDTQEDDVNDIERELQIKRAIKSEYSWHAKANMIRLDYEKVGSYDELVRLYEMPKAELQNALDCYSYAQSYLSSIGKTGQWSLVDKHEYAFKKILKERKRLNSSAEKKVFESLSAAVLQAKDSQITTRRYDVIPDIAKNLSAVVDAVKKVILPSEPSRVAIDPFGMAPVTNDVHDMYRIEEACRRSENLDKTVAAINDVLEAIHLHNRDERNSHQLLDHLRSISTDLISVKNSDLDDRQEDFGAIINQLDSIDETSAFIRNWVKAHGN